MYIDPSLRFKCKYWDLVYQQDSNFQYNACMLEPLDIWGEYTGCKICESCLQYIEIKN
jgi:hypothetical protein